MGRSRGLGDRDVEHDALLVVGLVAEPAADPLDLLDHPVVALGAGVGDAELEEALDLGLGCVKDVDSFSG